jgi:hypothetical protein
MCGRGNVIKNKTIYIFLRLGAMSTEMQGA